MECKKFWSYVIDFYIYYTILFIGSSIVKNLIMYNGTINLFRMPLLIVWFILILINDLMLGNRSIGKHMMEIEVVDEVKEHKKIKRGILSIFSSRKKEKS